jgi:hypothetical protein
MTVSLFSFGQCEIVPTIKPLRVFESDPYKNDSNEISRQSCQAAKEDLRFFLILGALGAFARVTGLPMALIR